MSGDKVLGMAGHREAANSRWIQVQLEGAVERALKAGFSAFVTGGSEGTEVVFAQTVVNKRIELGVPCRLEVRLPYAGYSWRGMETLAPLLEEQDRVLHMDEELTAQGKRAHADKGVASVGKLFERTSTIIADSAAMVVVLDGRPHGMTAHTFNEARKRGVPVYWINPTMMEAQWLNVRTNRWGKGGRGTR